ncbi:hypothetical protein F5884DRAFT_502626 [Xylogone sp. PMI_703]|nr:hypothetical protein F5884DRAFT_502626 [Xylogone sp. PMI_703]
MLSGKRKALDANLQRRVRARRESSEELESSGSEKSLHDEPNTDTKNSSDPENGSEDDDESPSSEPEADQEDVAAISFGALAKAQASLAREGRGSKSASKKGDKTWTNDEELERKAGRKDRRDFDRSSKHAPTEISSKKAVSRKREVIPVKKRDIRDPRFESTSGPLDMNKIKKAYSFLDDYREDEIKQLKETIKKTKDEGEKERLKKELLSMESKKRADLQKRKAQEILDQHKKEEKERVKQGKKPFFLKKSEQKKRLLLEQYGELKGKQLDHVIERRRKKVASKEKKRMPFSRRNVES